MYHGHSRRLPPAGACCPRRRCPGLRGPVPKWLAGPTRPRPGEGCRPPRPKHSRRTRRAARDPPGTGPARPASGVSPGPGPRRRPGPARTARSGSGRRRRGAAIPQDGPPGNPGSRPGRAGRGTAGGGPGACTRCAAPCGTPASGARVAAGPIAGTERSPRPA